MHPPKRPAYSSKTSYEIWKHPMVLLAPGKLFDSIILEYCVPSRRGASATVRFTRTWKVRFFSSSPIPGCPTRELVRRFSGPRFLQLCGPPKQSVARVMLSSKNS
ncbi:hypothetical protein TNCT_224381 [Trichonephila clavata]|uniref:Uncharacterized protein n=1 Tax=Trichonephila clavata TaxID=2740835 RepID=A0A8X6F1V9_TRICU|nr:hypothetical protein TNCT_224381 [Trichonephila clavata]